MALTTFSDIGNQLELALPGLGDGVVGVRVRAHSVQYAASVGVVFVGIAVIYIVQEVGKNKDDRIMEMMKKNDLALAAETEGYMDDIAAFFTFYLPKLKIFFVFVLWPFIQCMFWYKFTLPSSMNGCLELLPGHRH